MQKIPALTYQGCGNQIQSPTMGKTTRQCTKRDLSSQETNCGLDEIGNSISGDYILIVVF
jgi:hypothetical protein